MKGKHSKQRQRGTFKRTMKSVHDEVAPVLDNDGMATAERNAGAYHVPVMLAESSLSSTALRVSLHCAPSPVCGGAVR